MIAVLELSVLQCDSCEATFCGENGSEYFYNDSLMLKQAISKDWFFLEDDDFEVVSHHCPDCKNHKL